MNEEFPCAVPEIPVNDVDKASAYYKEHLGFTIQWGDESGGGIGGIYKGRCRLFLTNRTFREGYGNTGPVVIWLNLNSKKDVDDLHATWKACGARIASPPESKPWQLHEFTASDLDGNLIRVFYDFRGDS